MPVASGGTGHNTGGPNPPYPFRKSYATKKHKTVSAFNPLGKRRKKRVRKKRK